MPLEARTTLEKACFFLDKAKDTPLSDRNEHIAYLEAAISFGRSVTFHLQQELSARNEFEQWYENWKTRLGQIPESRFMVKQRNLAVHQGPVKTRRVAHASISSTLQLHSTVTVKVIRGSPWYRRSPKTLAEDILRPLRERLRLWRDTRRRKAVAQPARSSLTTAEVSSDVLYFDYEEWKTTPAAEIIATHLNVLEELVSEAEAKFE